MSTKSLLASVPVCMATLLIAALSGCSTTSLTDSWQAPGFQRKSMSNVLVVAMTGNQTHRILFEEGFGKALRDNRIQATASHSVIGNDLPTRESVTAYVEQHHIDFVILTDYAGTQVTKWVVPESVRTYYTGPYYPTYSGYWGAYGNTITMVRQSYVDQIKTTMLSTSIFEVESEALVWVGRSKSFDVESIGEGADDLAYQIIGNIHN